MDKRLAAAALAAAVLAAGCNQTSSQSKASTSGSTSSSTSGAMTPSSGASEPAPSTTTAAAALPGEPGSGHTHKLPSGLEYDDLVVGGGKMAEPGMNVSVNYTGYLLDGSSFDSSSKTGQPLVFQLGAPGLIAGFDQGVRGMRIGGKRKVKIPADMAYGADGRPPVIPPNSTLVFDLELVDAK